jgi:hypothetical protein
MVCDGWLLHKRRNRVGPVVVSISIVRDPRQH